MPGFEASLTNATPHKAIRVKPETFATYRDRLDFIHDNMEPTLKMVVIRADDLFKDETVWLDPPDSRFRLSFESETRVGADKEQYKFEPNFDANIRLPNLEHRWKVYFRSSSRDSISDRDEPGIGDGRRTRLGISRMREDLNLETDTGLRLRVRPEAYARLQWKRPWNAKYWVFRPGERLFYETDKGFGELTSFTIHRWLGRKPRTFIQSISEAEYSQTSEGVEFGQSFRFGKVREALEPMDSWTEMLGDRDIARGVVFRAGMYGHSDDESTIDNYRLGVVIRRPLYKKWMYLSINPELLWANDTDWETEFRLRITMDMLFWGSIER